MVLCACFCLVFLRGGERDGAWTAASCCTIKSGKGKKLRCRSNVVRFLPVIINHCSGMNFFKNR